MRGATSLNGTALVLVLMVVVLSGCASPQIVTHPLLPTVPKVLMTPPENLWLLTSPESNSLPKPAEETLGKSNNGRTGPQETGSR